MTTEGPSGGAGVATRRIDALSRHVAGGVGRAETAAETEGKKYAREAVDTPEDVVYTDGLRYTLNTAALTRRERENYEELGYHVRGCARARHARRSQSHSRTHAVCARGHGAAPAPRRVPAPRRGPCTHLHVYVRGPADPPRRALVLPRLAASRLLCAIAAAAPARQVVRNLIPQVELDRYADRFGKLCRGEAPPPPLMTTMRDVATKGRPIRSEADVTKIQSFEDDEVLFDYCKHPDVLKYVEAFCGPDIKSMHTSE